MVMPGAAPHRDVLVIGAGVSGLMVARRLQELGYRVRVVAEAFSPLLTSNKAAALLYPFRAEPEGLVNAWTRCTFDYVASIEPVQGSGVSRVTGIELFAEPAPDPSWRAALPAWARFRRPAPEELPSGYRDGYVFDSLLVEMDRFLPLLMSAITEARPLLVNDAGLTPGVIEQRRVRSFEEVFQQADIVVNCTGLGARELARDAALYAIRGQVARVDRMPSQRFHFYIDEHGLDLPGRQGLTYIIARSTDTLLGGTADDGDEREEPLDSVHATIRARTAAIVPAVATLAEHSRAVGLRPGRHQIRLERQSWAPGKWLIHNYGHGGSGVTVSRGCAEAVAALLLDLPNPNR